MSKKIKLGLVGYGYWGPNLLRNFIQLAGVEVVMVCDLNEAQLARVKKRYPALNITTDYQVLLASEINAVVIATPLVSHFKLAQAALLANKHVLVEKPFVKTSKQAERLTRLAKQKKLVLMVDHTFEYTAAVNKIKQLIKKGELGQIYTIDMIRVNLGLFQQDHNVIWDLAYHDVSILLYILGKMPKSVIALGQDFIQPGIEDSAYVIFRFPDKILASLHLSWLDPYKIRKATFVGSKKMLVYDDLEPTEKIKILDKGVLVKSKQLPQMPYYESFAEFSYLYRRGDVYIPRLEQKEPLSLVAEHFITTIKQDKKPRSGGEEGLRVTKILESVERSLKNSGREVEI
ncbi:Gfo/Idh/MocA family oxidoreductase [Patescibacteria group bacterium]|nr:Gfo/Idh/MocA family oxidoreductase [Patescibacteria group bacterium]MBU1931398.1 Gfo/Idh/MocA family oxidoreductase [Patescibacteria group bacterium]